MNWPSTGSGWEGWSIKDGKLMSPTGQLYSPQDVEPNKYTPADLARILGVTRAAINGRINRKTLPPFDGFHENGRGWWKFESIKKAIITWS